MTAKPDFSILAENWKSPFVARLSIGEFTGGMLHPRTMANLDSQGKGPDGRFSIGRKVGYPVEEVVKWLEERAS